MNAKEMLQKLNMVLTRLCGLVLLVTGCYLALISFQYFDETVLKVVGFAGAVFFVVFGVKYLFLERRQKIQK